MLLSGRLARPDPRGCHLSSHTHPLENREKVTYYRTVFAGDRPREQPVTASPVWRMDIKGMMHRDWLTCGREVDTVSDHRHDPMGRVTATSWSDDWLGNRHPHGPGHPEEHARMTHRRRPEDEAAPQRCDTSHHPRALERWLHHAEEELLYA